jgi:hypothetical protein
MAATKVLFPGCLWSSGPLTILHTIPESRFLLCFWQCQKHWICCINSEGDYFEEATTMDNEVKCKFHYWISPGTFGYALVCQGMFSLRDKYQGKGVMHFSAVFSWWLSTLLSVLRMHRTHSNSDVTIWSQNTCTMNNATCFEPVPLTVKLALLHGNLHYTVSVNTILMLWFDDCSIISMTQKFNTYSTCECRLPTHSMDPEQMKMQQMQPLKKKAHLHMY